MFLEGSRGDDDINALIGQIYRAFIYVRVCMACYGYTHNNQSFAAKLIITRKI